MDNSKKLSYIQRISLNNRSEEEKSKVNKLFQDNIHIAYKIAAKYYKTHYWDYEESLQIAQLGLFKACLIWDPNKYKLTTLAYNIINRDFIDFDKQQKKQPTVILSIDEEIKTADQIMVSELLVDNSLNQEEEYVENDTINELNQDIVYILDDIAEELNLAPCIVKMIYLVHIETNQGGGLGVSQLRFIKKSVINEVISLLQDKLRKIL